MRDCTYAIGPMTDDYTVSDVEDNQLLEPVGRVPCIGQFFNDSVTGDAANCICREVEVPRAAPRGLGRHIWHGLFATKSVTAGTALVWYYGTGYSRDHYA